MWSDESVKDLLPLTSPLFYLPNSDCQAKCMIITRSPREAKEKATEGQRSWNQDRFFPLSV